MLQVLNDIAKIFWDRMANISFVQQGNLVLCTTSEKHPDSETKLWNHLEVQCNGKQMILV